MGLRFKKYERLDVWSRPMWPPSLQELDRRDAWQRRSVTHGAKSAMRGSCCRRTPRGSTSNERPEPTRSCLGHGPAPPAKRTFVAAEPSANRGSHLRSRRRHRRAHLSSFWEECLFESARMDSRKGGVVFRFWAISRGMFSHARSQPAAA